MAPPGTLQTQGIRPPAWPTRPSALPRAHHTPRAANVPVPLRGPHGGMRGSMCSAARWMSPRWVRPLPLARESPRWRFVAKGYGPHRHGACAHRRPAARGRGCALGPAGAGQHGHGGGTLQRSRALGLLALQLRQFPVDRAEASLTGDILPPAHHEGAPRTMGPPLATGGVLQIGEPSMDGVSHGGSPSPLSGPHGCGPLPETYPTPCCRGRCPGGAVRRGMRLLPHGGSPHRCLER